jgi:hypothetical protein
VWCVAEMAEETVVGLVGPGENGADAGMAQSNVAGLVGLVFGQFGLVSCFSVLCSLLTSFSLRHSIHHVQRLLA